MYRLQNLLMHSAPSGEGLDHHSSSSPASTTIHIDRSRLLPIFSSEGICTMRTNRLPVPLNLCAAALLRPCLPKGHHLLKLGEKMDLDLEPDMDCIDPGVYLGTLTAACNWNTLKSAGITHILTVDTEPLAAHVTDTDKSLSTLYIQADDRPHVDLLSHFEKAIGFMSEACDSDNGAVLVHCFFGVSRSATLVIAYLMRKHQLTVHEAVAKVKEKRPVIGPNPGFLAQLQLFEKMGCKLAEDNTEFKLFKLENYVAVLKKGRNFDNVGQILAHDPGVPDGNVNMETAGPSYRCKTCRRVLFTNCNLLSHTVGQKPSWLDSTWQVGEELQTGPCTLGLFIEPMQWMSEMVRNMQGKFVCPKCEGKVGSFNWLGLHCGCGAKVVPGFHVASSKVDED